MNEASYLHGFTDEEQKRLIHQARFLEPYVYPDIDLYYCQHLLEVGCGVGAQSEILLRRFPDLKITGVDLSSRQLDKARRYLAPQIKSGRIELLEQNAQELKLRKKNYDAAFLCWFLEYVPDPLLVLQKTKAHLRPGATIYLTEVFNQSLFMEPYSPAYLKYWFEFNDYQWSIQGHPFIGARLGNLLHTAGFSDIQIQVKPFHFDSREPQRRADFIEFFFRILLSAESALLKAKRVDRELIEQMKKEVEKAKKSKDSVFFYTFLQATARVPLE